VSRSRLERLEARVAAMPSPEPELTNAELVELVRQESRHPAAAGRLDVAATLADVETAWARWLAEDPGATNRRSDGTAAVNPWPEDFLQAFCTSTELMEYVREGMPDSGDMAVLLELRAWLEGVGPTLVDQYGYLRRPKPVPRAWPIPLTRLKADVDLAIQDGRPWVRRVWGGGVFEALVIKAEHERGDG